MASVPQHRLKLLHWPAPDAATPVRSSEAATLSRPNKSIPRSWKDPAIFGQPLRANSFEQLEAA
eukprot:14472095-Alexandrium_andersonii.AAC.1